MGTLGLPPALVDPLRAVFESGEGLVVVAAPPGEDVDDAATVFQAELAALGHAAAADAALGAGAIEAALDGGAEALSIPRLKGAAATVVAVRAAATGRLVVAGVEAEDLAGALSRLLDAHADPVLLGSAFRFALCRRRLRRVCGCARRRSPAAGLLEDLRLDRALKGLLLPAPAGCPACRHSGYAGTTDVWEGLGRDERLAAALAAGAPAAVLRGSLPPFRPLAAEALDRLKAGLTTIEELRARIPYLQLIRAPLP
jgi:general secretion pathway protein E